MTKKRCDWGEGNPLYQSYHDQEWGVPIHDDRKLFEFLILEGMQAVRNRPEMYIGDRQTRGLHHLIGEVVDNSVDEAMAGRCSSIKVSLIN